MRSVILRCPSWMFGLIVAGAFAPLAIVPLARADEWPAVTPWILVAASALMLLYALMLLRTRLVISDEGVCQTLLFSESRLRWEDIVEWRHCEGGAEFEEGEFRAQTKNRWHLTEFWVRDRTGHKHRFKRWLVFGKRSRQVAEIMREHGIAGG